MVFILPYSQTLFPNCLSNATSFFQMKRYGCNHDIFVTHEPAAQQEGAMVVQQIMPPFHWNELGNDNLNESTFPFPLFLNYMNQPCQGFNE